MQISVLGVVTIRRDGADADLGDRLRRLLAALVVSNGSTVSVDRLVEVVWAGNPPDGADQSLRSYVTRLRRAIGSDRDDLIVSHRPGYSIDLHPDELDSAVFDDELGRAIRHLRAGDANDAIDLLEAALGRWHGDPYAGFADEEWARPEAVRLAERRTEARETLVDALVADGRHDRAVADARALIEAEPLRETPRVLLMRSLYLSGRQAEAMRVAASFRSELADETGLEASDRFASVEQQIARGDLADGHQRVRRGYELGDRIGEGAYAVVHRAVQPGLDREVAVKIIRPELADSADFIRRFEVEARTVARIEHPNVVPLYDFWREPGAAYLVMRLFRGGTVERALRAHGPYSRRQVVDLLGDIGPALDTAHRAGVVHRDVRPANLLLDEQGITYLADFGIALPAATRDEMPVPSPDYAAPEVLRGDQVDASADVLSLGVSVFEMLTGRLPFDGSTDRAEVIRRQLVEPLPSVAASRPDLPVELDAILARATAKAAPDRYGSVLDFVDEVTAVLAGASGERIVRSRSDLEVANPYVGLHAFDEQDAGRFFGRERLVTEVVEAVERHSIVTVVGPSGSGKSSAVRAGLLPAVRRGVIAGSDHWFITTMMPGTDPFDALEVALLRVAVNPPATLREQLAEPGGLSRAVRRVLPDERSHLLLVIDQFEELFAAGPVADRFLTELSISARADLGLRVVTTLRADHYDAPLQHRSIAELVTAGTVAVRPLRADELERAIVLPARTIGVDVEPALVAELIADVSSRPTLLPLLQFSLTELFDRRQSDLMLRSTHHELGGITGSLAARADQIVASGDARDEQEVRRIFGRLIEVGADGSVRRRRALRNELGEGERVAWLVDAFVTARLLTVDREASTRRPTVEIAHEALVRDWPRLGRWIDEDHADLVMLRTVSMGAASWIAADRDPGELARGGRLDQAVELATRRPGWLSADESEWVAGSQATAASEAAAAAAVSERDRRQNRRLRVLLGVAVAFLLIAGAAAVFALVSRNRAVDSDRATTEALADAEANRRAAEAAGSLASGNEARAEAARDDAEAQAAEAEAARRVAEEREREAETARSDADVQTLISRSASLVTDDPSVALLLALESHRRAPGPQTESTILNTLSSIGPRVAIIPPFPTSGDCNGAGFVDAVADGPVEYLSIDGRRVRRDLTTGAISDHGPLVMECSWWAATHEGTRVVEVAADGLRVVSDTAGGVDPVGIELTEPAYVEVSPTGPVRFVTIPGDGRTTTTLEILDGETGERVGAPITGMVAPWAAFSPDGASLAVSGGTPEFPDGGGPLLVLDAASGVERFRVDLPQRAQAFAWDDSTGELLAAGGGRMLTIDVATGAFVADVELGDLVDLESLIIRDDGTVVVIARGRAVIVDRRLGPLGTGTELRDTWIGLSLPDGNVLVGLYDGGYEVLNLDAGAVADLVYPAPGGSPWVEYAGGTMTSVDIGTGVIDVVDVETGERERLELVDASGEPVPVIAGGASAVDGVFTAITTDTTVSLWRGEELVSSVQLGAPGAALLRGSGSAGRLALSWLAPDGSQHVSLVSTIGEVEVLLEIDVSDVQVVAAAADAGLHTVDAAGVLRTYDDVGNVIAEVDSGLCCAEFANFDSVSGLLVLGGADGTVVHDPASGTVTRLPGATGASNVALVRDGAQVVVGDRNGSVRLWDVATREVVGVLVDENANALGTPKYDREHDAVWIGVGGKAMRIPLDPARWVERACEVAGRELTPEEWDRFVPGDVTQVPACT